MFVLAVAVVIAVWLEGVAAGWGWVGALGLGLGLMVVAGWRVAVVGMAVAMAAVGSYSWRISSQVQGERVFAGLGVMKVEGRLLGEALGDDGAWRGVVRISKGTGNGAKVWWQGGGKMPVAGSRLRAFGEFKGLDEDRNPGMTSRAERLRSRGVVAVFRASEMRAESAAGWLARNLGKLRQGFREGITFGLEEDGVAARVIRAVVLGERSHEAVELVGAFRYSGTLHVFTVSGLHVAMVAGMAWFVLRWAGVERKAAIIFIVPLMFGYAWLAGNGPAALRAAWMGTLFLAAFGLMRRPDLLNSLGVVLLCNLLWDGRMLSMPGVQLSYGVVAAIGLGAGWGRKCFGWISREERYLPMSEYSEWQRGWLSFRRKLADSLAVSTAAWVGSTPLTMLHFGLITPVSIVATVALVPQVFVILGVALIAALVHPVAPGAAAFLNKGNGHVATFCADSAGFFARLPGAWFTTRSPGVDTLVIYDLDYGGGAACFSSARGRGILIDGGGRGAFKWQVAPSLKRLGIEPDSVIFTHADAGHVVAADELMEIFPIKQVAHGLEKTSSPAMRSWLGGEHGARMVKLRRGDRLEFSESAWAEVLLSPLEETAGSLADDQVLVFRLHWDGWKILWMSDAGRMSEDLLIESGVDLKADVIVAGCHASDIHLTEPFISAVNPQLMVVGRDSDAEYVWARPRQMEIWGHHGVAVIDQGESGGITVTVDGDGRLVFDGFADGRKTLLERRR